MRALRKGLFGAVGVSCLIGAPAAQEVSSVAPLTAGGLTIGGPGAVTTQPSDSSIFWASAKAMDICVTVVNFGTVAVSVQLSSLQFAPGNIGRTIAVCAANITNVTVTCGAGTGECRYLWRVDKAG
jgi:hypothetical protein